MICLAKPGRPKDIARRAQAWSLYKVLKNQAAVAREMGVDPGTISRWAREEDWDARLSALEKRVGEQMGLDKMKEEQEVDGALDLYREELGWLREMAIEGLEAFKKGEVTFERMSDVRGALNDFIDLKMRLSGVGKEDRSPLVQVNVGGSTDRVANIKSLLTIIAASGEEDDELGEVIESTVVDETE